MIRRREVLRGVAGLAGYAAASRAFARARPLRVGVIGGGIVGASIASTLSRAGALPASPDVHVAVTHSGVTLAPIIARHTADEVLHGSRVGVLAPYRPERFLKRIARAG